MTVLLGERQNGNQKNTLERTTSKCETSNKGILAKEESSSEIEESRSSKTAETDVKNKNT